MKIVITLFLLAASLSGCVPSTGAVKPMVSNVNLTLNESPKEFTNTNKDIIKVITRPPGVNFYKMKWGNENLGMVTFKHGENTFSVEHVISANAVDNRRSPDEGLIEFNVYAGIGDTDLIGHDDARKLFISALQRIRKAGWKIFINEGDPRLRGKAMLDFALSESPASSLDADYEPTFVEWMKIPSDMQWQFYVNHAYLTISFTREPTLLDPHKPGSYLITYTLQSENEHLRNYVTPKQKDYWKSALPLQLEYLPAMRKAKESELRAQGVEIDETYMDAPIPAFIE